MAATFAPFDSWAQVLDHIRAGRLIWYHAPMDYAPVRVTIARLYKNGKIRVLPPTADADAFTADSGHLSRFRCEQPPTTPPINARQLVSDLWWFIENATDDLPDRTDRFFALRVRVREYYAATPKGRVR